jgi:hypothetical protein
VKSILFLGAIVLSMAHVAQAKELPISQKAELVEQLDELTNKGEVERAFTGKTKIISMAALGYVVNKIGFTLGYDNVPGRTFTVCRMSLELKKEFESPIRYDYLFETGLASGVFEDSSIQRRIRNFNDSSALYKNVSRVCMDQASKSGQ